MRNGALAVIVCISLHVSSLYASCKTEACKQATAWKNGYTAIVLNENISRADYFAVLDAVKANKGVVAIEAERVLLGWIPTASASRIRAARGVSAVLYEAAPKPAQLVQREQALAALSFFNHVRTGEFEDTVEAGLTIHGQPLTDCVHARPASNGAQVQGLSNASDSEATENMILRKAPKSDELIRVPRFPGVVLPQWDFHTPYQNPDMRGRVTVQLFRLDSDGTSEPNEFTWTSADIATSNDQVFSAFTFWVDQATAHGVTLSFTIKPQDPFNRYTRSTFPTPTHWEPIRHNRPDDYLWVNDALTLHGYGSSVVTRANVFNQNDAFNRASAADPNFGPYDRSFSVYLIYNPPPAPAYFTDGNNANAYFDGPFATVLWNSGNSGPENLGVVLTHETGHIFWACDEYASSGCICDYCVHNTGPRPWVINGNCDNGLPFPQGSCNLSRGSCMMKDDAHTLCQDTPSQIGW